MSRILLALLLSAPMLVAGPTRQDRIRAVESGILQPVQITGVPPWTLSERMQELKIPGASIAVIHNFQVDWSKGYGKRDVETGEAVTAATLFQAASISKPVTAAGALHQVEMGVISLDADINQSLKSWKVPKNEFTGEEKVTLRRLLSHSAGLTVGGFPGYPPESEIPTPVQVLSGGEPVNTPPVRVTAVPGSRFRYSGGGTTIVQLALMDLTGLSFPELIRRTVLDPAGMSSSSYEQPLPPALVGEAASGHRRNGNLVAGRWRVYPEMAAAGLWTTSGDLARFAIEIQKAYRGESGRILSPSTAREMLTPVIDDAGLGLFLRWRGGAVYFEHGGSNEGFRSALVAHRDRGYGAVVMVNSDNGQILNEIIRGIAAVYDWEGYGEEPRDTITLSSKQLDRFAGTYLVHEDYAIRITRQGGILSAAEGNEEFALFPVTPLEFIRQDRNARYAFGGRTGKSRDTLLVKDREPAMAVRVSPTFLTAWELLAKGEYERAQDAYRRIHASNRQSKAIEEERLNTMGYEYLRANSIREAITILELNTEFYPDSWNVYDSLAEAYMQAGENEEAISLYRRSLELNPANENGMAMLEKLLKMKGP